jgi:transposase-like protein
MARKGQKFRRHTIEFKRFVVGLRLEQGYSLRRVCRIYALSSENVIKWTQRFLAGEPLAMPRGRPRKTAITIMKPGPSLPDFKAENELLRAELAYKDELLRYFENRETVKKKKNSESSND